MVEKILFLRDTYLSWTYAGYFWQIFNFNTHKLNRHNNINLPAWEEIVLSKVLVFRSDSIYFRSHDLIAHVSNTCACYWLICILLTPSNNQISKFRIPNILFTCLIKQQGETFCNLYIEITQPFLILSKSQRSLKMCSQNH